MSEIITFIAICKSMRRKHHLIVLEAPRVDKTGCIERRQPLVSELVGPVKVLKFEVRNALAQTVLYAREERLLPMVPAREASTWRSRSASARSLGEVSATHHRLYSRRTKSGCSLCMCQKAP